MERDVSAVPGRAGQAVARRAALLFWLRRTHGWFGLWGALFGLLLGTSGVWLNHRATMKLELPGQTIANAQLALPDPAPGTAQDMAAWLQQALKLERAAFNVRIERARPVPWLEKADAERSGGGERPLQTLRQPERWLINLGGPDRLMQAEYWVGNRSVGLRTTENGFIATLTNLHKGTAMPVPWVLLVDTVAGSLIFLSLSGALLWWMTNRRRRLGLAILGASVSVTVGLALWSLSS
jgi:hypothetical protein